MASQGSGDIFRYAGQASDSDIVAVLGGDGTLNEAYNGLADKNIPLLVLPIGTANVVARELELPLDPMKAVEVLKAPKLVEWDTGLIGDTRFLFSLSVGFDAAAVHKLSDRRTGPISSRLTYVTLGMEALASFRPSLLRIEADGEKIEGQFVYALIINTKRYAGSFRLAPNAEVNDGELDLVLIEPTFLFNYFRYGLSAMTGVLQQHPGASHRRFKSCEIHAAGDMPVQIDGEKHGQAPVKCSVQPASCVFVVPENGKGKR